MAKNRIGVQVGGAVEITDGELLKLRRLLEKPGANGFKFADKKQVSEFLDNGVVPAALQQKLKRADSYRPQPAFA